MGRDCTAGGFMQVGHGKLAPLRRLCPGDRVAYYSSATTLSGTDKLQSFVSIGVVRAGDPYKVDMGHGFVPWRRDVAYAESRESSILPLLDQLDFIEDPKRWGYKFRFGMFEVHDHDIRLIANAMGADTAALHL